MKLEPFAMERLQSVWENRVAWNVSESGVHPLRVEEVAETDDERSAVLAQSLGYPQTNGTPPLRESIATMYPGATIDHIEVTNGGSEANCIALWHLVEPGDEVVMMAPNYMQVGGIARALGARVVAWPLVCDTAARRWRPDLDLLERLVTPKTRLVLVCNPNNPTGARLKPGELDGICRIASRHGAWVLSDEIYRGAELDDQVTETMWGRYERVLVTSGLSKAYGLPGLRIGWVAATPELVAELWGVHDYTSIAPGAVNDCLARIALAPSRRSRLLARTRAIIRTNYPVVRTWIDRRGDKLWHVAAGRRSDRLRPLRACDQLDAADGAPPRRAGRARGSWRPLRNGWVPAHRFRRRARGPDREPQENRRDAGFAAAHRRRCALTSRSSASATSRGVSSGSSTSSAIACASDHDLECRVVGIATRRLGAVFDASGLPATLTDDLDAGAERSGAIEMMTAAAAERSGSSTRLLAPVQRCRSSWRRRR